MSCQNKSHSRPKKQAEWTTDEIRDQRKKYKDDIVQPWREGVLSKEYLNKHGDKNIKVTEEEKKTAQYVWSGEIESGSYYNES